MGLKYCKPTPVYSLIIDISRYTCMCHYLQYDLHVQGMIHPARTPQFFFDNEFI